MWCSSPQGPYFGRPQAPQRGQIKVRLIMEGWQSDANLFHKHRLILGQEWQHAKMPSETSSYKCI